jgi:hypothetical protein
MSDIHDVLTGGATPAPEHAEAAAAARALLEADDPTEVHPTAALKGPVAAALVGLLTERKDALRLVVLRERAADKPTRKAAGKALYTLKSKGTDVPELVPERRTAFGARPEILPSYITNADPSGLRFYIYSAWETSGPVVIDALVGDSEDMGLHSLHLFHEMSKTRLGKLVGALRDAESITPIEADPGFVRHRILSAIERNKEEGRPLPEDTRAALRYLANDRGPETPAAHPAWLELSDELRASVAQHLGGGRALAEQPETLGWGPGEEDLQALIERLTEIEKSPILVSPTSARELASSLLDKAIERRFGEARGTFAARLEDLAYVMQRTKRQELALAALASAEAFRDDAIPVLEIPLARHMFERFFDLDRLVESIIEGQQRAAEGDPENMTTP